MAKPTLYSLGFSPTCLRVFPTLALKGIEYDNIEVDITKKERPAAFNAVSPFGKVPVLVHDGRNIIESVVINEYLDEVWPKPAMLPVDPAGRAYARQWIVYFNRVVTDRDGEFVHRNVDKDRKQETCRRIFPDLAALDRELAGKDKLFLGADLSLVDVAIAPFSRLLAIWSELVEDRQLKGYRNLLAYFDRLEKVPLLQKTVYHIPREAFAGFFKTVLVEGATIP
jgi:glutathione S-transferase